MQKNEIVQKILSHTKKKSENQSNISVSLDAEGCAFAPSNIALVKYWGKRDEELNLPVTSSLSISLSREGAFTRISHIPSNQACARDIIKLNGNEVGIDTAFAKRLREYLNLFRPAANIFYFVETKTSLPIASGLASSACGFAALAKALNQLYKWNLSYEKLSILARLGSGSACRSLWNGFVEWHKGKKTDGMDSYAEVLPCIWHELRVGIVLVSKLAKSISSREAMKHTMQTSAMYAAWQKQAENDLTQIKKALTEKDFALLGETAEYNAMAMHALMHSARPPIVYSQPATLAAIERVWDLRRAKIPVFFTQDAGANLQLLFLSSDEPIITKAFPEIEIIAPFADIDNVNRLMQPEQLILVDKQDREIGVSEKMAVHLSGQLHRAFSVFIFKKEQGKVKLLLQKRSHQKYHSPDLWTNTCCGHPQPHENLLAFATRRLQEEMGIKVPLKEVASFIYYAKVPQAKTAVNAVNNDNNGNVFELIEHEFDHVFVGYLSSASHTEITPNPAEVQEYQWMDLNELKQDLANNPIKYTAWLTLALEKLMLTQFEVEN